MQKRVWLFLAIGLGSAACSVGPSIPDGRSDIVAQAAPESLSTTGEQELRAIIAAGKLPDLQWPNFSDHSVSVKEFYQMG
jgi:hypothetical protein